MINGIVEDSVDSTLGALADPTRRRVVDLLRDRPLPASAIAEAVGMTPAATSRHLRVLRRSGLVAVNTPPDDARLRIYRLAPERLVALQAWLDQVQAHWAEQLGSFRALAEQRASEGRW